MMEGWVKIHRCIVDNDLWHSEPFSRGQAWIDLIILANHKESYFYKRGNKITVLRGQVGRSEVELSDRWRWSRTKVRKFLIELEKEQQIKIIKSTITQVLTIVNYDAYQEKEQQTGQQKDIKKTAEVQQKNTYKNEKKEKNDNNDKKKEKVYPSTFSNELIECFDDFLVMRKKIGKPLRLVQDKIDFLAKQIEKIGLEAVQIAVQNSIDNQYQGIFPKALKGGQKEETKGEIKHAYALPSFQTAKQREWWFFQKFEFYKTLDILENRLCNTTYRKLAYEQRQPEKLIQQLETEFPILLQHPFNNDRWQNIQ